MATQPEPAPQSNGRRPSPIARLESTRTAALFAGASLLAEAALLAGGSRGLGPMALLAGHAAVLGCLAVQAFAPSRRTSRHGLLLWVATAVFGPFGSAGALLTLALERHYARTATELDEWHAMLFPPSTVDESAELWRRIGQRAGDLSGEQRITPFLDVLAFGTVSQRQSVIAIIVQQFNPAFAPALKAALRDEHNVIRVQAATAIARLENEFLEATMKLETAVREQPEDAAALLALATHYDDQAFAGLLDPTREQDCRVKAAEGYDRYLAKRPDDNSARFRLARLHQRRGLWAEAERLFRHLLDAGHPSARHWYMETLFAQGRYGVLREVAAATPDAEAGAAASGTLAPEVADTVALWAGREVTA